MRRFCCGAEAALPLPAVGFCTSVVDSSTTTLTMLARSLTALLYLASFALSRNLTFVRPRFNTFDTNDDGFPRLTAGENVTIQWESDFRYTSLIVYQEVERGHFQGEILARMYSPWTTTLPAALATRLTRLRRGCPARSNGGGLESWRVARQWWLGRLFSLRAEERHRSRVRGLLLGQPKFRGVSPGSSELDNPDVDGGDEPVAIDRKRDQ